MGRHTAQRSKLVVALEFLAAAVMLAVVGALGLMLAAAATLNYLIG